MTNGECDREASDGQTELSWTVWPAARRPWVAALVVVFCVGFAALAWQSLGSEWYGVVALIALTCALGPYLFPTRYTLGPEGVRVQRFLHSSCRLWSDLRTCFEATEVLVLCPYAWPSEAGGDAGPRPPRNRHRLVARSLVLDLADADADAVRAYVGRKLPLRPVSELEAWLKTRR